MTYNTSWRATNCPLWSAAEELVGCASAGPSPAQRPSKQGDRTARLLPLLEHQQRWRSPRKRVWPSIASGRGRFSANLNSLNVPTSGLRRSRCQSYDGMARTRSRSSVTPPRTWWVCRSPSSCLPGLPCLPWFRGAGGTSAPRRTSPAGRTRSRACRARPAPDPPSLHRSRCRTCSRGRSRRTRSRPPDGRGGGPG